MSVYKKPVLQKKTKKKHHVLCFAEIGLPPTRIENRLLEQNMFVLNQPALIKIKIKSNGLA